MTRIAVTSRSFSKHSILRNELAKRYSTITFNDAGLTLKDADLIHFLQDHDMAIVGLERFNEEILTQLPNLKVISRFGVGIDTLDLVAMKKLGIRLAYTAGANKRSVVELVIALAINLFRQLPQANQEIRAGIWQQRKGRQLTGSAIGIIGLGAIGKDLALLFKRLDCTVYAFDIIPHPEFCQTHHLLQVDLETALSKADVVSLHLPLNRDTQGILDTKHLSLMKADAILINTARGGLVDEQAVKLMLQNNKLAAAAFDVFAIEPPIDQELLSLPNFFATPHIGGSTEEAILAMGFAAIDGLEKAAVLQ